ncbi:MAG: hypothetical protein IH991_20420 [Planctomycetes bacterium]|nr:hypothetical protein [Planctomycetota bacterium]
MSKYLVCLTAGTAFLFGLVSADAQPGNRQPNRPRDISEVFKRFDKDKNGTLEGQEIPAQLRRRIKQIDTNKDGKLSLDEVKKSFGRGGSGRRPGEIITRPARGERHSDTLKVGDLAPDFMLTDPSGKREVTLSSFKGKKPVVLIFGSYT